MPMPSRCLPVCCLLRVGAVPIHARLGPAGRGPLSRAAVSPSPRPLPGPVVACPRSGSVRPRVLGVVLLGPP